MVRTSPDELSFVNAQAWKDAYGHGPKGARGSTPHKYWPRYDLFAMNNEKSVEMLGGEEHARVRRIFNPAFSDRAVKQQEPVFMKYVNLLEAKLREGLEKDPDHKFDMVTMFNFTTFDIMGDLTFGEPLQLLANGEYNTWVKSVFGLIRVGIRISILLNYPILLKTLKACIPASVVKKSEEHFQNSVDRVTKRLEKGRHSEGADFWSLVLDQPEGRGLTRGQMDANAGLFMLAGTETTATLLSGLTYLLLQHPEALKLLTSEIRKAFDGPGNMSIEKVAALPYLNACIKEGLRLYPPVVTGMPRQTPSEGSTICGEYVPPGVSTQYHWSLIETLLTINLLDSRICTTTRLLHVGEQFQGAAVLSAGALARR